MVERPYVIWPEGTPGTGNLALAACCSPSTDRSHRTGRRSSAGQLLMSLRDLIGHCRTRRTVSLSPVVLALIHLGAHTASAETIARSPWTTQDLDRVTDAAIVAIDMGRPGTQATELGRLADALTKAGYKDRAIQILVKMGSSLPTPNDLSSAIGWLDVIEKLTLLGDDKSAERLANVDTNPPLRARLLGRLGKGRALAGNLTGADNAADRIASIPETVGAPSPALVNAKTLALTEIGLAFDKAGATGAALHLVGTLPDGLQKLGLLSRIARTLCKATPDQAGSSDHGRLVAEQLSSSVKNILLTTQNDVERRDPVAFAAEAIAECDGPRPALDLIHATLGTQQASVAQESISNQLARDREMDLARAVAPLPNPDDPADLLDAARRLNRLSDPDAALTMAKRASAIAIKVQPDPTGPQWKRSEHETLLLGIAGLLAELGSYDDAVATVQPAQLINREQFYPLVLAVETRHKDRSAIDKSLPEAIEVIASPTFANGSIILHSIVLFLIEAGYQDEARQAYVALQALLDDTANGAAPKPNRALILADLKAVMGDMPGALAAAEQAGPLTEPPNAMRAMLAAVMSFDGATKPPTKEELAARLEQMKRSMPGQVPGPKATALAAIVQVMAKMGDINAAVQAEAGLEQEPRDVLRSTRDSALVVISAAQLRAGDPNGAFATALRVDEPASRLGPLRELTALHPNR
jgi:tetratricopeptide (TPR) repeat protein